MKKSYFAIRILNHKNTIIVHSWEECKQLIDKYPAIYNQFPSKKKALLWLKQFSYEDINKIIQTLKKNSLRTKCSDEDLLAYIQKGTLHLIKDMQEDISSHYTSTNN